MYLPLSGDATVPVGLHFSSSLFLPPTPSSSLLLPPLTSPSSSLSQHPGWPTSPCSWAADASTSPRVAGRSAGCVARGPGYTVSHATPTLHFMSSAFLPKLNFYVSNCLFPTGLVPVGRASSLNLVVKSKEEGGGRQGRILGGIEDRWRVEVVQEPCTTSTSRLGTLPTTDTCRRRSRRCIRRCRSSFHTQVC